MLDSRQALRQRPLASNLNDVINTSSVRGKLAGCLPPVRIFSVEDDVVGA